MGFWLKNIEIYWCYRRFFAQFKRESHRLYKYDIYYRKPRFTPWFIWYLKHIHRAIPDHWMRGKYLSTVGNLADYPNSNLPFVSAPKNYKPWQGLDIPDWMKSSAISETADQVKINNLLRAIQTKDFGQSTASLFRGLVKKFKNANAKVSDRKRTTFTTPMLMKDIIWFWHRRSTAEGFQRTLEYIVYLSAITTIYELYFWLVEENDDVKPVSSIDDWHLNASNFSRPLNRSRISHSMAETFTLTAINIASDSHFHLFSELVDKVIWARFYDLTYYHNEALLPPKEFIHHKNQPLSFEMYNESIDWQTHGKLKHSRAGFNKIFFFHRSGRHIIADQPIDILCEPLLQDISERITETMLPIVERETTKHLERIMA